MEQSANSAGSDQDGIMEQVRKRRKESNWGAIVNTERLNAGFDVAFVQVSPTMVLMVLMVLMVDVISALARVVRLDADICTIRTGNV